MDPTFDDLMVMERCDGEERTGFGIVFFLLPTAPCSHRLNRQTSTWIVTFNDYLSNEGQKTTGIRTLT